MRRLGKYELIARIGKGGMAQVYLARQRGFMDFEKLVVVKTIHPHLAEQKDFINMLLDEARIAARIDHPCVVDIYDLGVHDDTYFIAMEHLNGQSLVRVLRAGVEKRPLDIRSSVRIIADVADGLHAAHELKDHTGRSLEVIHRDVTPGNIVVQYSGRVKIVDFGIAKARGRIAADTGIRQWKGKLNYMAPEHVTGKTIDRRADIFSLGVVLWESLCLRRLFRHKNASDMADAILEQEIPPPSSIRKEVPPKLDSICLRALARDPDERYATCAEFEEELEKFLSAAAFRPQKGIIAKYMREMFADEIAEREEFLREVAAATSEIKVPLPKNRDPDDSLDGLPVVGASATPSGNVSITPAGIGDLSEPQIEVVPGIAESSGASDDGGDERASSDSDAAASGSGDDDVEAPFFAAGDEGKFGEGDDSGDSSAAGAAIAAAAARAASAGEVDRMVSRVRLDTEARRFVTTTRRKRTGVLVAIAAVFALVIILAAVTGGDKNSDVANTGIGGTNPAASGAAATGSDSTESNPVQPAANAALPSDGEKTGPESADDKPIEPGQTDSGKAGDDRDETSKTKKDRDSGKADPGEQEPDEATAGAGDGEGGDTAAGGDEVAQDSGQGSGEATSDELIEPGGDGDEVVEPAPDGDETAGKGDSEPDVETPSPNKKPKRSRASAARALYKQGIDLFVAGKLSQARDKFRASLRVNSRYAQAHRGLGLVFERMGKKKSAAKAYREYLRLAPKARDAKRIRSRLAALGG